MGSAALNLVKWLGMAELVENVLVLWAFLAFCAIS